jgi:putative transposase
MRLPPGEKTKCLGFQQDTPWTTLLQSEGTLSCWDVEELMLARGLIVTYEAIRQWCRKFGQTYANQLRRRRPQPGDTWHRDEVFLTINGTQHYLWRVVDQEGNVLDILVQRRRDKTAAKKCFRKLLKGCRYVPPVLVTDRLKSHGAAKREMLLGVAHRQHRSLNSRAENSLQPTRQRERRMQGFKSPRHAQRFPAAYGPIASHFRPRRHRLLAPQYRHEMTQRFHTWKGITSLPTAAYRLRLKPSYVFLSVDHSDRQHIDNALRRDLL